MEAVNKYIINYNNFKEEGRAVKKPIPIQYMVAEYDGIIKTLEGVLHFKKGDYIIKGIKGELYACDKGIFEDSYSKQ